MPIYWGDPLPPGRRDPYDIIVTLVSNVWRRLRERWQRPRYLYVSDDHVVYGKYTERRFRDTE